MNVLVLATPQNGVSRVWTLPRDPAVPAPSARVPESDTDAADALVNGCKGDGKSWQDWADQLAEDSPYLGTFSVEEAPDPMDAQQVLGYLRGQAFLKLAGLDEAPPPLKLTTAGTGTKQPHSAVNYHAPSDEPGKRCITCFMFDGGHCTLVEDPIYSDGICERWIPVPVA